MAPFDPQRYAILVVARALLVASFLLAMAVAGVDGGSPGASFGFIR
jgi:hypothetical protein